MTVQTTTASSAVHRAAGLAAEKGFHLYNCAPITGASRELWMLHRGASMRFFTTPESLLSAVEEMEDYEPVSPQARAQEATLRKAMAELMGGSCHDAH